MTGQPPYGDAKVPAFWRALGVPGPADIHTHFLPPRMLRQAWEHFDAAGPLAADQVQGERLGAGGAAAVTRYWTGCGPVGRGGGAGGRARRARAGGDRAHEAGAVRAGLARLRLNDARLRAVCWDDPVTLFGFPVS